MVMRRPVFILVFLCFCFFYGVHSESCRGLTVLTSSSGTIEDHSGPGNYSHDVFCQWLITTNDTNERITLRFNRFDLKSDPTNGDFDYLNINDGDSFASPALVWFTSNELPKPVQSSGKSLFLTFQSSSRGWTGRGFSLEYSITSCINHCGNHGYCFNGYCHCDGGWRGIACGEAFCEEDCGSKKGYGKCDKNNNVCVCKEGYYGGNCLDAFCDRLSYLTSKSGTFTDHHKEISGNNYYLHNANCSWLISVPDAEFIKVSFTYFDVEEYWDYVTIFQGNNHNGLVLGNYSGKNIPPSVTAHGNQVFINFVTDVGLSAGGFVAQYTSGKLSEVGFSGGAVLAVGFLCLLLGAGFGVGAMFLWERYKDRKEGAQYHPVPFDDQEDLVDSERN